MDFASIIAGVLKAAGESGGILQMVRNIFGSNKAARKAMARQKELMDYSTDLQKNLFSFQNDINVQNWDMQNAYNAPIAEKQRLRDAGLNTNLMYAGNGSVAGNAESVPAASGGSPNVSSDMKVLSGLAQQQQDLQTFAALRQFALQDSEVDLNRSQAEKNRAEAEQVAPNAGSQRAVNAAMERQLNSQAEQSKSFLQFFNDTVDERKRALQLTNLLTEAQKDNFRAQTGATLYNLNELMPLEKKEKEYYLNTFLPAQVDKLKSEMKLTDKQALVAVANEAYYRSLKYKQDIDNGLWSKVYSNPQYVKAMIFKPINENNLTYYKARSERLGFPYLQSGFMGTGLSIGNLPFIFGSPSSQKVDHHSYPQLR